MWRVVFSHSGYANFWLGSIPSSCNYELVVYDLNDMVILGESFNTGNSQELLTLPVTAGRNYFIYIFSAGGSSNTDSYKMRVNLYPNRIITSVPLYQQESEKTCNAANVRMVLARHGVSKTEQNYLDYADILTDGTDNDYTYVWVMVSAINHFLDEANVSVDYKHSCISSWTLDQFKAFVAKNIKGMYPIICQIKSTASSSFGYDTPKGHYVLIKGSGHNSAADYYTVVNDPHYDDSFFRTLNVSVSEIRTLLRTHANGGYVIHVLDN